MGSLEHVSVAPTAEQVRELLGPLPLVAPDELWLSVHAAYGGSPRCYHTFDHVADVARHYRTVESEVGWQHPIEACLAVLYHDAVYRVGSKTNEHDSAALAREQIARWLPSADVDAARVAELIDLTARHGSLSPDDVDADAALFLDCDMAILGAADADYDRYAEQVAAEYAPIIPGRVYREGRAQFLDALLAAQDIFLSDLFRARLGAAAHANLRRERDALLSG